MEETNILERRPMQSAASFALELQSVSYRFQNSPNWVLADVDLQVPRGALVLLTGPSGSGKSTLLRVIRGLHKEYAGEFRGAIHINGDDVAEAPVASLGNRVAIVFQNPSYQLHQPRVIDEVMSAPIYQGLPWNECLERANAVVRGILDEQILTSNPTHLSLGQQQRVAIAASLALKADLVLLDEPFSYLDSAGCTELVSLIRSILHDGKTVVVATHEIEPLAAMATAAVVLDRGRIVVSGVPGEAFHSRTARKLFDGPLLIDAASMLDAADAVGRRVLTWAEIAAGMMGCETGRAATAPGTDPEDAHPALAVSNLAYRYPNANLALNDVSFSVRHGEIFGIVGPNGSGKTTLARIILGLTRPIAGTVEIRGRQPSRFSNIAREVGYVTQNPTDMLFETTVARECRFGPSCLRLDNPLERVAASLAEVGLSDYVERDPRSLSGGEQRLLSLAAILVNDPAVLILDEPEFGLDPSNCRKLRRLLRDLRRAGKTILMITHKLDLAAFVCDRLAVLEHGRVLTVGETVRVFSDPAILKSLGADEAFFGLWDFVAQKCGHAPSEKEFLAILAESLGGAEIV